MAVLLAGCRDGRLKARVKVGPMDGKANQMFIAFLVDILSIQKQDVTLVRGDKSRLKTVMINVPYDASKLELTR